MDTPSELPPPLPPLEKKAESFSLPLAVWIAWDAYAAVRVALFAVGGTPATPYAIGELIGGLVGSLLLPGVLALLVWRIAGRSRRAGTTTFLVVFGMVVLGQVAQFARNAQANAGWKRLEAERRQLAADSAKEIKEGRPVDPKAQNKIIEKTRDQLDRMAGTGSAAARTLVAASKTYMDDLLAAKQSYDAALAKLSEGNFWELAPLAAAEVTARRRIVVRAFLLANTRLASLQDEDGAGFRRALAAGGAPAAEIDDAVKGYKKSTGGRLALIAKVRATDAAIGQAMLDFLDFADAQRGKWSQRESDAKIIFDDTDAVTAYNAILARVEAASAEQGKYQAELAAPKP
jgi:hypothetical protein